MPAKSKSQKRFMGMVLEAKRTGHAASAKVREAAKSMSASSARDFAKGSSKGLPEKKAEAYVDGFISACDAHGIDPEVLVKSAGEPSRPGSYIASLLPFGGSAIYGAIKKPGHRLMGAARGIGGDIVGSAVGGVGGMAGGMAGGSGGTLLASLIATLLRKPQLAASLRKAAPAMGLAGAGGGGVLGAIVGGGEGTYRALKG